MTFLKLGPRALLAGVLLGATLLLVGCGDEETVPEGPPPAKLPEGLSPGWNTIAGDDTTGCVDSSDFAFYVRPGITNKLAVIYSPAELCFDDQSCMTATTEPADAVLTALQAGTYKGLFDDSKNVNPLTNFWVVVVPQCGNDAHIGATLAHRGGMNGAFVHQWVTANFGGPEILFVLGQGSGGLGALFWSTHFSDSFPDSAVRQLSDSGTYAAGPQSFWDNYAMRWDIDNSPALPADIPELASGTDWASHRANTIYTAVALAYETRRFGQYSSALDPVQTDFYGANMSMGDPMVYYEQLSDSLTSIYEAVEMAVDPEAEDDKPWFTYYVASGEHHLATNIDVLYESEDANYPLINWVRDFIEAPTTPPRTSCNPCIPDDMMP